jgi:hypothetical protein
MRRRPLRPPVALLALGSVALASVAAAVLLVIDRWSASRQLATGDLWPRPDGSYPSFGVVWDYTDLLSLR